MTPAVLPALAFGLLLLLVPVGAGPALAAPATSGSRPALALFARGLELEREGQPAAALALYRRLLAEHPTDELVDDTLYRAAELLAERLGDPARALALYQTLQREHPASRWVARAAQRAAELPRAAASPSVAVAPGPGPPDEAELQALWAPRDDGPALQGWRLESFLLQHGRGAAGLRAALTLAQLRQGEGRLVEAEAILRFGLAAAGTTRGEWRRRVAGALGNLLLLLRRDQDAAEIVSLLAASDDAQDHEWAAYLRRELDEVGGQRRLHRGLLVGVLAVLVALTLVAVRRRRGWAALLAPRLEVRFLAPPLGLLLAVAWMLPEIESALAASLTRFAIGVLLYLQLAGTVLGPPRRDRPGWQRLVFPLLGVGMVTALAVSAVLEADLLYAIEETAWSGWGRG